MNVVSQPVGLLRFPFRSNSIFQSAPRAVSILKRSPFLLKAKPLATRGWEPRAQGVVNGAGQTVLISALAPSATKRSPMSLNAIPSGVQGVGSLPTKIKDGGELDGLILQTGQNV